MAWNDDGNDLKNTILSTGSAAGSLLGQAIGLSPVIAGGAIAFNRIRSNQPISSGVNSGINKVYRQGGENLDKLLERNNRAKAEQLRMSLLEGGEIK